MKNLRVAESVNSDVVAVVAEDLRVGVGASRGGDGGGDEQGEYDELLEKTLLLELLKTSYHQNLMMIDRKDHFIFSLNG